MLRAYRLPGYRHGWVAAYRPEFHQIWTNPRFSQKEINGVLCEEFVHSTLTHFRPSELLPLRNYLTGAFTHPRHDEFRDLVEALYYASYPLATDQPVDADHPPELYSPHRALGRRILALAEELAEFRSNKLQEAEACHKALWALTVVLGCVVPLAKGQGVAVLEVLSSFRPAEEWATEHELFEKLVGYLSKWIKEQGKEAATFTLTRPNDAHELLVKATGLLCDFRRAPMDRVVPATPALLSTLTLGLYHDVYLFWLLPNGNRWDALIEDWSFTEQNIAASLKALRQEGVSLNSPSSEMGRCKASFFHANCLVFLRDLLRRRPTVSPPFLVHEMLELFPYMLNSIVLPMRREEYECPYCRIAFDDVLRENALSVAALSSNDKLALIDAAARYEPWLQHSGPREIRKGLGLRKVVNLKGFVPIDAPKKPDLPYPFPAYAFPAQSKEKWAEFLPALGQIWVFPECPEALLNLVLAHERYHHDTCALQPSQLLPLRHALLCRPLPEPDRFSDIMEASYVLGLTLAAGVPLRPEFFPLAAAQTKRLAAQLARKAWSLAATADKSLEPERASIEAGRAILMLLHHIVPAGTGLGGRIVKTIERIEPSAPWHNQWELWQQLYRACHAQLARGRQPFTLALPMDPHRLVPEMLIFLAHALTPIPERREAVLMTFPSLVNVLSLATVVSIPVVRLKRRGKGFSAEISVIHGDTDTERVVQAAANAQSELAGETRRQGLECNCARFFADFLQESALIRSSQDPNRLARLMEYVVKKAVTNEIGQKGAACSWCAESFDAPTVRHALAAVEYWRRTQGGTLVRAAELYEKWLLSDGMKLMQQVCGFDGILHVRRDYEFL